FVFFDQGITVTYAELYERVRRVANGLLLMGVRKGTHIAMMLPNAIEFPVTWLAIAWVGAVSIQLNPKFTGRELDYTLNDADADYLIIDEKCLPALDAMEQRTERLPDANIIVRTSDSESGAYVAWQDLVRNDPLPAEPPANMTEHDLMTILYTSGTTGFPKGCMLDHRYWLQLCQCVLFIQGGHTPRNVLVYEPMFYMQGNGLFIGALLWNATTYCAERPSISKFLEWVQRYAIDYCAFPEPVVHIMDNYPSEIGKSLKFVHSWYFHGDGRERVEKRFGVIARDSFAMTENGVDLYVPTDRPDLAATGSMGVPAPWREICIVDKQGNVLADGEVGEMWTAGPGHMDGYYRKTFANRESFHGRWFRTGDLVQREASGGYYLIGRIKDMIKRSGENISAAEVEDCLCRLSGIVLAAVVAVPNAARGEEVKAYVKLRSGLTSEDVSPKKILAHCAENLAAFKVPRYLAYTEVFPMTVADDKVSKSQLTEDIKDLTAGAYDRISDTWH
ncbi:MAG: acyl--CoA ligase, partial [Deltaproteobacteria bacterium]|nr:acyl--CoA ligase [Deltaproteobacteria bacterium]